MVMKIAVAYEDGHIFEHFGRTGQFKIYDVEKGKVIRTRIAAVNGEGHGALAAFLKERGTDTVICGGIGPGAQTALAALGIRLYGGVTGSADEAVQALLAEKLIWNPHVQGCGGHEGCR